MRLGNDQFQFEGGVNQKDEETQFLLQNAGCSRGFILISDSPGFRDHKCCCEETCEHLEGASPEKQRVYFCRKGHIASSGFEKFCAPIRICKEFGD